MFIGERGGRVGYINSVGYITHLLTDIRFSQFSTLVYTV